MRIALLGARPNAVRAARALGWEIVEADARPDVVVALAESEVERAAALRAELGLSGLDPETAHVCHDKAAMKSRVRAAGLPCTDWREAGGDPAAIVRELGLPLVVKPRASSGGRGLVIARTEEEARAALRPGLLAERFLHGVEMSVESFVCDGRVVFVNFTEYFVPRWANVVPASLDAGTARAVRDLNARAIEALGVTRGMTHLEVYLTAAGPVFGELAVRPPGGRILRLLRGAYGFDPWRALLRVEAGDTVEPPPRPLRAAGVWVLHPGAGRVVSVAGLDAARAVPGIVRVVCRAAPGDALAERAGTGQDVGFLEARAATRDEVKAALRAAHAAVSFTMA